MDDELLLYYTKDGSVGLYNSTISDVYHSAYGAYSEACNKFINPAQISSYLNTNKKINILDICYGIGYNTKSLLNYFFDDFLKNKNDISKKLNDNNLSYNEAIYGDNKTDKILSESISPIDDDNIIDKNFQPYITSIDGDKIFNENSRISISSIDGDKNNEKEINKESEFIKKIFLAGDKKTNKELFFSSKIDINKFINKNENLKYTDINKSNDIDLENSFKKSKNIEEKIIDDYAGINNKKNDYTININAVDIDKTLIKISPLLKNKSKKFKPKGIGIKKVDELLNDKKNTFKELSYNKCVNYILVMKLIDEYKYEYFSDDVIKFLRKKQNQKYIDKNMVFFAKFYLKNTYKLKGSKIKSAFLHNIYYRYISKSYKMAKKLLNDNNISINFSNIDARKIFDKNFERYDVIFLDAFTPSKTPMLWTYDFILKLYSMLNYDGVILTYTNSAPVRNAFLSAGFYAGKIFNKEENKFTGTIASKNPENIKYKFNKYDLGLIHSKSGIMYRDENLDLTDLQIISNRNIEVKESNLQSCSNFIKNYSGDKNAIV